MVTVYGDVFECMRKEDNIENQTRNKEIFKESMKIEYYNIAMFISEQ